MTRGIFYNAKERSEKIRQSKIGKKRKPFSKKWKINMSKARIGNTARLGKKRTLSSRIKQRLSMLGKHSGNKNPSWKGGLTSINLKIRSCFEYRQWRSDIFTRDNFICVNCGCISSYKNKLNADHIIPLSFLIKKFNIKTLDDARNIEELWDINNGRTLCENCHKKTDTYSYKAKKWI